MKRTTISLPDELAAALEREANRRRVPVSQVAREAIEARLGLAADASRDLPFIGIVESDAPADAARDLEEYRKAGWAEDINADAFDRPR